MILCYEGLQQTYNNFVESFPQSDTYGFEDYGCGTDSKYKIRNITTSCSYFTDIIGDALIIPSLFENIYFLQANYLSDRSYLQYDKDLKNEVEILDNIYILK